ncbi:MAG TPA: hypothetical protein VNU19_03845 [Candidatus Acidoferrum sp.]|nr:hypothetical protein [Candidatus Acidoferrum sp.]
MHINSWQDQAGRISTQPIVVLRPRKAGPDGPDGIDIGAEPV